MRGWKMQESVGQTGRLQLLRTGRNDGNGIQWGGTSAAAAVIAGGCDVRSWRRYRTRG
uniref:Uncharacterized protein n=1 Tax=Arundo donax TaxID=35708 RepID=A0A0A9GCY6_ARUDO